jgi:hypothetical protein
VPLSPLLVQEFVVGAGRPPASAASAFRIDERGIRHAAASQCFSSLFRECTVIPEFLSFVCRTKHFARNYQGVSHPKWPKENHEYAPTQTGSVICCTIEAVDIECPPPRAEELSKRAKKL